MHIILWICNLFNVHHLHEINMKFYYKSGQRGVNIEICISDLCIRWMWFTWRRAGGKRIYSYHVALESCASKNNPAIMSICKSVGAVWDCIIGKHNLLAFPSQWHTLLYETQKRILGISCDSQSQLSPARAESNLKNRNEENLSLFIWHFWIINEDYIQGAGGGSRGGEGEGHEVDYIVQLRWNLLGFR